MDEKVFKDELEYLVNIDSGSYVREGVNRMGDFFAGKFKELNWPVEWFDLSEGRLGRSFLTYSRNSDHFDLLILCHLDTVFPDGEAIKRPFTVDGSKYRGPGVADMKAGLLFTYYVLRELHEEKRITANIGVFFNNEHEISCPHTRPKIEELSLKSSIVITSEPARSNGAFVYKRKGIGRYSIKFFGKSVHSGLNPQEGISALTELAQWILFLTGLSDPKKEIYINPGVAKGGKSVNSVPGEAELLVDTRFWDIESGWEIDRTIKEKVKNPFNPAINIEIDGGIKRPPMIPSEKTDALCRLVEKIGKQYDLNVQWTFSGGGSDASFSAALGIPSLCGLTAPGGNLHSENEYLDTTELQKYFAVYKETIFQFSNLD